MKILILCTGNSCRSQMAEGFLRALDKKNEIFSAGTNPSNRVHPKAIKAMAEAGIDISHHRPEHVERYLDESFDFLITVCGGAKESCPAFFGNVGHRLHIGFDDPAEAVGNEEEVMNTFRRVRDEIKHEFKKFYDDQLK
ncbi:MAG: arsenate reductase ArsC [Bacteroidales bacterium]|nr:arsenate reductase ArsC [Bacteroidales bacterium]